MSTSIYNQQPPTSGKIILETSQGELEIELWCNEAPLTCRNFISLCLEGYYDNTIFHRLIKNFMIQGGDPTGSGQGGDSIYGKPFKDEFHQRLKFTQRGLVAMANTGVPDDNGSQFFVTFQDCEWLNKKHTIFGKVIGETIYNLIQMQDLEVDDKHRPLQPPKIIKVRVVNNPFDDLVIRNLDKNKQEITKDNQQDDSDSSEEEENKIIKKQKISNVKFKSRAAPRKKQNNLLSFGDEEEDDEENQEDKEESEEDITQSKNQPNKKIIMSSHDVLHGGKLSSETAVNIQEIEKNRRQKEEDKQKLENFKKVLKNKKGDDHNTGTSNKNKVGDLKEESLRNLSNQEGLQQYKTRINKKTGQKEIYWINEEESNSDSDSNNSSDSDSSSDSEEFQNEAQKKQRQKQKEEYENLKLEELKFKRGGIGQSNVQYKQRRTEEHSLLSNLEKRKLKFLEQDKIKRNDVLTKMQNFRSHMFSDTVKKDKNNWLNHKLKFHIDSQRAYSIQDNKDKAKDKTEE